MPGFEGSISGPYFLFSSGFLAIIQIINAIRHEASDEAGGGILCCDHRDIILKRLNLCHMRAEF